MSPDGDVLFLYEETQPLTGYSYGGIHITDDKDVTLFYNKACEEIEGIKKEGITGRNVQNVWVLHGSRLFCPPLCTEMLCNIFHFLKILFEINNRLSIVISGWT